MNKGGRNQQTARAGEYYVAAELNRRGAYAVTFAGNMPKIDIFASDFSLTRKVSIQVKSRLKGTWQCSSKDVSKCQPKDDETAFWIFVDLSEGRNPPDYYIVYDWWIKNNIYETNIAYIQKRVKPVISDSYHHSIDLQRLVKWKDRWDILDLGIL